MTDQELMLLMRLQSNLYAQVLTLLEENKQLRSQLEEKECPKQ